MLSPENERPPLVPGLPLLGSALAISRGVPAFLTKMYRAYGPIFRIRMVGREFTVMAGVDANLFMAKDGDAHLSSRDAWADFVGEYGATVSVMKEDGELHARLRKLMKRGYSRSAIAPHLDRIVAIARDELRAWPEGKAVSVTDAMKPIITEQLGQVLAGRSPRAHLDDLRRFLGSALAMFVARSRPPVMRHLPGYRRARARVMALGREVLESHRTKGPPANPEARDLIDDLLAAVAEEPTLLAPEDLLHATLGPFIAGLDTVASASSFLLYALAAHPEVMARARAEADALFAATAGRAIALDDLKLLKTLTAAAMESLRMYPIAPAAVRTAASDFSFGGHRVARGTNLLIATSVTHFLEELHPAPHAFDIDRYAPPRNEHRIAGAYAPFGAGAHICLGAGLAESQLVLTVATLLHEAELTLDPPDYQLRVIAWPATAPDRRFRLRVRRRRRSG